MSVEALTDGRRAHAATHELSVLSCWKIKFDRWTFHPVVAVRHGTDLATVEAFARGRLLTMLERQGGDYAQEVAEVRVTHVDRLDDVALDPRIG